MTHEFYKTDGERDADTAKYYSHSPRHAQKGASPLGPGKGGAGVPLPVVPKGHQGKEVPPKDKKGKGDQKGKSKSERAEKGKSRLFAMKPSFEFYCKKHMNCSGDSTTGGDGSCRKLHVTEEALKAQKVNWEADFKVAEEKVAAAGKRPDTPRKD